jgi:hypothetical protein
MNNCFIDYNRETNVPQSNNKFYSITKDANWKYAINIQIDTSQELDYTNLFLILKSYIYNSTATVYSIGTSFKNKDDNLVVTQKEDVRFFKKTDLTTFTDWLNYRINNDWKYDKADEFYSIFVLFEKKLVLLNNKKYNLDILDYLKPIYPWTDTWLDFIKNSLEYVNYLEKKIEYMEKKKSNKK